MADMDTYDDQRGYEGNYYTTSVANNHHMFGAGYEHYGRREFDSQPHQTRITTPVIQPAPTDPDACERRSEADIVLVR